MQQHESEIPKWMDARERSRRVYEWDMSCRKPIDWMTTIAATIVSHLIWLSADTHDASISYASFAVRCCCGYNTIDRAIKLLEEKEWVTRRTSDGKSCRLSLTDAYLNCLTAGKQEITPEIKAFAKWYRDLQKSQPTGVVSRYGLKEMDTKNDSRHHVNAAEIIERCGSVERAKDATQFAVKFKKKAIQTIYNLKLIICGQPSFMEEWKAFEQDGTTPEPSSAMKETEQEKFYRLLKEQKQAVNRRNANRHDKSLDAPADAANDAVALQAMRVGIPPSEFALKGIYDVNRYREIWKTQYEKGGQQ